MDEQTADIIIQWFEMLEEDIVDYMKSVPPMGDNMKTFSPRLATLIIESGGLIDSIFRHYSPSTKTFSDNKTRKKDDYNINDFAEIHGPIIKDDIVILLQAPPSFIAPFSVWSDPKYFRSTCPPWWQVHNDLKHSRIDNLSSATLDIALNSLAALFAVFSHFKELVYSMMRKQWIAHGMYNMNLISEAINTTSRGLYYPIATSLFALIIGTQIRNDIRRFDPALYACSEKITNFFRK